MQPVARVDDVGSDEGCPLTTVCFDLETALIQPGNAAPPLVCGGWADTDGRSGFFDRHEALPFLRDLLAAAIAGRVYIVNHNIAFDWGVAAAEYPQLLPAIFAAYRLGRIEDTLWREQLADLAEGNLKKRQALKGYYTLANLAKMHLGVDLDKVTYRTGYGHLIDVPVSEWPQGAIDYAVEDARTTRALYLDQFSRVAHDPDIFLDSPARARAAWALHLASLWGVRTSPEGVAALRKSLEDEALELRTELVKSGIVRPNGTENQALVRELVAADLGEFAPRTKKSKRHPDGQISIAGETLEQCTSQTLKPLARYKAIGKDLSFVEALAVGTERPINPRWNPLVETGRASCSSPNLQQLPRKQGVRECVQARPGYDLVGADYATLEIRTLAQVCLWKFGFSRMAELLAAGKDLHVALAAQLLRTTYEDALARKGTPEGKNARALGKVANFSLGGGCGPARLVATAKSDYGIDLEFDEARKLKETWLATFPEMVKYFHEMGRLMNSGGAVQLVQFVSRRRRGGVDRYTQACNTPFQGLAADGALAACFEVQRLAYTVPSSPLFGSHLIVFAHDELILESPSNRAPEAAEELARVMVEQMAKYVPDIPIAAEPLVMGRNWSKAAGPVRDENGRLVPWDRAPKKAA